MEDASLISVAANDAVILDGDALPESPHTGASALPKNGSADVVAAWESRTLLFAAATVLAVAWFPYLVRGIHYWVYTDDSANWSYLVQALLDLPDHVTIVVVVLYVMYRDGRPWSAFGITRPRWIRDPLEAFAVLITTYFIIGRVYSFSGMVIGAEAIERFSESSYEFVTPATSLEVVVLLLMSLGNGLSEEIAMRGYLLPTLERLLKSTPLSVFLTSMIFASYHIYQGFGATVWVFIVGLVFGIIFAVWRRLWPLVLAHAAMNVLATLWPL